MEPQGTKRQDTNKDQTTNSKYGVPLCDLQLLMRLLNDIFPKFYPSSLSRLRILIWINQMTTRVYDLEERTFLFAKRVRLFAGSIPRSPLSIGDLQQLVRSAGSVGANYCEANDALGRRDFVMKCRISRKEAKEARFWLRLILETSSVQNRDEALSLTSEATELVKILSSIIQKSE